MPYRTTRRAAPKLTADFLARARANGIDAGAKRIEVRVERDASGGEYGDGDGVGFVSVFALEPPRSYAALRVEPAISRLGRRR